MMNIEPNERWTIEYDRKKGTEDGWESREYDWMISRI